MLAYYSVFLCCAVCLLHFLLTSYGIPLKPFHCGQTSIWCLIYLNRHSLKSATRTHANSSSQWRGESSWVNITSNQEIDTVPTLYVYLSFSLWLYWDTIVKVALRFALKAGYMSDFFEIWKLIHFCIIKIYMA